VFQKYNVWLLFKAATYATPSLRTPEKFLESRHMVDLGKVILDELAIKACGKLS